MAPTDTPIVLDEIISSELPDILEQGGEEEEFSGTDKSATPAERWSKQELDKNLARARPQLHLPQRDSDAKKKGAREPRERA